MSITTDVVNLRFNVTPDYKQQHIQQMEDDLNKVQREAINTRKELDKYTQKMVDLQGKLSQLKFERHELEKQGSLSKNEAKELEKLNSTIEETEKEQEKETDKQSALSGEYIGQVREMRNLERQMKDTTHSADLFAMSLNDLRQRQKDLNMVLSNLSPQNEAYAALKREYDDIGRRIKILRQESLQLHNDQKFESLTINELTERQRALNTALRDCDPNEDEFKEYSKALQETNDRIKELQEEAQETKSSLLKFTEGFNQIGFAITNFLAIKDRIVAWADQYVQAFAKMDDAMTDVMKYTGQTKTEVEEMNETFKKKTTRTPREELNALAGAAGRLSIQGKKDIEGFVDAADKINVALGDDLQTAGDGSFLSDSNFGVHFILASLRFF